MLQHATFSHPTPSLPKFLHVPLGVGGWSFGLIVRAKFRRFPTYMVMIHQRHRRTDGQTTSNSMTALCTVVHRAVNTSCSCRPYVYRTHRPIRFFNQAIICCIAYRITWTPETLSAVEGTLLFETFFNTPNSGNIGLACFNYDVFTHKLESVHGLWF